MWISSICASKKPRTSSYHKTSPMMFNIFSLQSESHGSRGKQREEKNIFSPEELFIVCSRRISRRDFFLQKALTSFVTSRPSVEILKYRARTESRRATQEREKCAEISLNAEEKLIRFKSGFNRKEVIWGDYLGSHWKVD